MNLVATTVSTLQGGGQRGHRIDAEAAAGGHLVPVTFQKTTRPASSDHPDIWERRDQAATLSPFDLGSESRAVELVVQPLAVRGREDGAQLEVGPEGGPANALRTPGGGSSLAAIAVTGPVSHTLTAEGSDASEDGTGRVSGEVMPAMGAKSGGNGVQTETTVRRLTPRECERLQGFPDDWTATSNGKPQTDSPRYRQMGNAVAVPCVEWIARRIVASDGGASA